MYSRPEKLSHRQTIIYEIDMIEYCYDKLVQGKEPLRNRAGYALLECFLLHYRNLIEFFGKDENLRRDDLSISKPEDWAGGLTFDAERIKPLLAIRLYQEYEGRDDTGEKRRDTISRYLQHCTKQRAESKDWPVKEIFDKIGPLIKGFRSLCEDRSHVATDNREFVVGPEGAHTATIRTSTFKREDSR